ncbi:MAG: hypothetical protein KF832_03725 [Caldilineaceae bacterium]|nr:hypothetical protein [Caldilineaceae bacterium]
MTKQTTSATTDLIPYPLQTSGYIHHWLVAGPHRTAVTDLARFSPAEQPAQIAAAYQQPMPVLPEPPTELTTLAFSDALGAVKFPWQVVRCGDDHLLDYSDFFDSCHYLRTWAYTEIELTAAQTATFQLASSGPAEVWINGAAVYQHQQFTPNVVAAHTFTTPLHAGRNAILIAFSTVALHASPYFLALRITDLAPTAGQITLPTTMTAKYRQGFERLLDAAYIDKDLYHHQDEIIVRWPAEMNLVGELTVRLQTASGKIYTESHPSVRAGSEVKLGKAYQRLDGDYWISLMPKVELYYVHGMRIRRNLPIRIANSNFAETTYGTYAERAQEALTDAAKRTGIYSELAKMALGQWDQLKLAPITQTITQWTQQATVDSVPTPVPFIGLLGARLRYGDDPNFPPEIKTALESYAIATSYGANTTAWAAPVQHDTANHEQFLHNTSELLAGQAFPAVTFQPSGQPGRWHQQVGEEQALAWLRQCAYNGFAPWDSDIAFEQLAVALSHLADLAENAEVAEMAAVVLDKLCFTLALNSFRGVFGSTHGSTTTAALRGGRLAATTGISRLLWGLGAFHDAMAGTVSLACAESYELPPPLLEIATTPVEALWSKERHMGPASQDAQQAETTWEVNKATYKTADAMLCSAQGYRPGTAGERQHIWQATLGVGAVIFVNHPARTSQNEANHPNFWRGNARLPHVAQWKDALLALYHLPDSDLLGFTHAYFPTANFDAYEIRDGWAFARKGDGYVALTAHPGLTLTTTGHEAYRELRANGTQTNWFCQLGRSAVDGTFADFQAKILALPITLAGAQPQVTTLREDTLTLDWAGPFTVNGDAQPLPYAQHYDSPFCVSTLGAEVMEIRAWQQAMQLDFRQQGSTATEQA